MIKDDSTVVLIGKRNTGKSYLTKDMLYYKQDLPAGTVISQLKTQISFMVILFHQFLYTMNMNLKLQMNLLKDKKHLKKKWYQAKMTSIIEHS
jgi:hypothetical protein